MGSRHLRQQIIATASPSVLLAALAIQGFAITATAKDSDPSFNPTYTNSQYDTSFLDTACQTPGTSYSATQDVTCSYSGDLTSSQAVTVTSAQTADNDPFSTTLTFDFSDVIGQSSSDSMTVIGAFSAGQTVNKSYRINKDSSNDDAQSYWGANAATVTVDIAGSDSSIEFDVGTGLYGDYTLASNGSYNNDDSDYYYIEAGGGIALISIAGDGFEDNQGKDSPQGNFTGGTSGALTLTSDAQIQVNADYIYDEQTASSFVGGLLGRPAIRALTVAGDGAANKTGDLDFAGNGGDGGAISISQTGAITFNFNEGQAVDPNPFYGVWATSEGGVGSNRKNDAIAAGGPGGDVSVSLLGQVATSTEDIVVVGTAIGVLAESVGGNSDFDSSHDYDDSSSAGDGGTVTASLGDGSDDGAGGIDFVVSTTALGLMSASSGGQAPLQGLGGTGGDTSVVINPGTSVSLTAEGGTEPFLLGAMSLSSGSTASLNPSADIDPDNEALGTPGTASITNQGDITLQGGTGFGLVALSIGGAATVAAPSSSSETIDLGVSTDDQIQNTYSASEASLTNSGSIQTEGSGTTGMLAMSVGGSGGLVNYLGDADTQFVNMGGTSSQFTGGGDGGSVAISNSGSIVTGSTSSSAGDVAASMGLVAQSIGGGGGNSTAPAIFVGANDTSGSGGGTGGTVSVSLEDGSAVTTYGTSSIGVLAQSVGGGGGNGANTDGFFATVGGQGGNGGNGGEVTITQSDGAEGLVTMASLSYAMIAQSVGGGGGTGGSSTVVTLSPFSASVGGGGGAGGNGNAVSISNGAPIATSGVRGMGLLGQSIGGGGGTGGAATDDSIELISIDVAVGGSGGTVGQGDSVTVTNSSTILTGCDSADTGCAELQQVVTEMQSTTSDDDSSSDESSDASDDASQVAADESTDLGIATVNPQGADAVGILAQSIGGGGGDGGTATATSIVVPDDEIPTVNIPISVGGSGGAGGDGGQVSITNSGALVTPGDGAFGVVAQSIGGGGGNGGDSTATSSGVGSSQTANVTIDIAIGGNGGGAGNGGAVTLTNAADQDCVSGCAPVIATFGQYSTALLAQSIGGGGGTGGAGSASDNQMDIGSDANVSVTFGLGGSGGSGGDGDTVSVSNGAGATLSTTGTGARGILAQSIGGGGGMAGGANTAASDIQYNVSMAMGAKGGSGDDGGDVTVQNDGVIRTGGVVTGSNGNTVPTGGDAAGILAQSIGGGGGAAGSSSVDTTMDSDAPDFGEDDQSSSTEYVADISIGGTAGAGGNGGALSVGNTNEISTQGIRAHGVHAQTIGSGGGVAGTANSASDVQNDEDDDEDEEDSGSTSVYNATVSVGGSGGGAGNGGDIQLTNSGSVSTLGYGANGFFAQSIGGGGGQGAEGTVDNSTTVSISAGADGNDGSSGDGGTISVTDTGSIVTVGDDSYGFFVQSIGGGGGVANNSCTNSVTPDTSGSLLGGDWDFQGASGTVCIGNREVDATYTSDSAFDITIGGDTGSSGQGGAVTLSKTAGSVSTLGGRSFGVIAQSIGGGGGLTAASIDTLDDVKVNDNPGNIDGTGGDLTVTLGADTVVQTFGDGAWGVFAQSIGGSGGFAGDASLPVQDTVVSNSLAYASASGQNANAGTIDITLSGAVATFGSAAHGIVVQGIGGGGGFSSTSSDDGSTVAPSFGNAAQILNEADDVVFTGNGGRISITQETDASIAATGADAIGIFAQSSGNDEQQNPISILLNGSVTGGTASAGTDAIAAGIFLTGGLSWGGQGVSFTNANSITLNAGSSLTTTAGTAGTAILSSDALTIVENAGSLTGSVILQTGASLGANDSMISNTGSLYSGQQIVSLGMSNDGYLAVFGDGEIGTTSLQTDDDTMSANFTQSSGGTLAVDIDASAEPTADLFKVSGSVQLMGSLQVSALAGLLPGAYQIMSASDMTVDATVTDGLLYSWTTTLDATGTSLSVTPSADFTPDGIDLTAEEQTIADCLQNSWDAGGTAELAPIFGALSGINNSNSYITALSAIDENAACS